MKGGRHSSTSWLRPVLTVILGSAGWALVGSAEAGADTESRAVGLCCAWGSPLRDGVLTYSLDGDDPTVLSLIQQAVQEWDDVLSELSLEEVPPGGKKRSHRADIAIVYGPGEAEGGETAASGAQGLTTSYLNSRRMIKRVEIGIDGGPSPVDAGAVEQIAKHELGHALGLGHANWDGELMSPLVQPTPAPIPSCDIDAVRRANSWKMVDKSRRPKPSPAAESPC